MTVAGAVRRPNRRRRRDCWTRFPSYPLAPVTCGSVHSSFWLAFLQHDRIIIVTILSSLLLWRLAKKIPKRSLYERVYRSGWAGSSDDLMITRLRSIIWYDINITNGVYFVCLGLRLATLHTRRVLMHRCSPRTTW